MSERVLGDGAVGDIDNPEVKSATVQPGLVDGSDSNNQREQIAPAAAPKETKNDG